MHTKFWSEDLKGSNLSSTPTNIWEDNIRMDLRKIGLKGVDWMRLAQSRAQLWTYVNAVMNLVVP
jgi:hypothetical protein